MSINNTDHDGAGDAAEERQFAELTIGDDEFVIYDRDNHQAWIQSTVSIPIEEEQ